MKRLGFSGELPLRVMDGTKTETRRIIPRPAPGLPGLSMAKLINSDGAWFWGGPGRLVDIRPLPGRAGERRAMTEPVYEGVDGLARYSADKARIILDGNPVKWWPPKARRLPARYCPARVSRATLELLEVRAERLRDITPDGVRAEGIRSQPLSDVQRLAAAAMAPGALPLTEYLPEGPPSSWTQDDVDRAHFAMGWNLIGKRSVAATWEANPWVFVIRFRRVS